MKSQLEPIVLTNSVVSILLFSMLTMGMTTKFSDINILQTWADASSFANSIASRAYTSSDCFAYESGIITKIGDKMVYERKVFPGIIDARKFSQDNYITCIENYYSISGSQLEYLTKNVPTLSIPLVYFELYDLEEPDKIRELGNKINNEAQLDWGITQEYVESTKEFLKNTQIAADIAGFIISVTLSMITPVEVNPVVKMGNLETTNDIDNNLVEWVKQSYSTYVSQTPVIIRYVDENGNIETDHQGILKTTIKYRSNL